MKQIGLWIDHKRAVILEIGENGEAFHTIESDIEPLAARGAKRTRRPYSAQYPKGEDHLDNQYEGYLHKYYENVLTHLRDADAVLIMGPGEAKIELKKRLETHKLLDLLLEVQPADKMTDRQFAAKVRDYFEKVHA